MVKFLLIAFLIAYVLYKVGGFIFRVLFASAIQQQQRAYQQGAQASQQQSAPKRPQGGNVNIDYIPKDGTAKAKKPKTDLTGGDYVDYEIVK